MSKILTYILIFGLFITGSPLFSQIDKILKPVEVTPPHPGKVKQEKEESDIQLAAQYFRNREYDKAIILYEKLYEEKPNSVYYTYYLYCLIELGEFKDAEKLVKKQIRENPGLAKYEVDLGYVYSESGDQGKAKKQFESALRSIDENKAQVIQLSNAFLYRGQPDYAAEVYIRGSEVTGYPFYLELGDLYRQTGNLSKMVDAYLDYVDFDYLNTQIVQNKLQRVLDDDPEDKVGEYLRVALLTRIQKDPNKVYFSEMLMWLAIQKENYQMALEQAEAIDRRMRESGNRVLELADIALSNKQYDVAAEAYRYVLKKGKDNIYYIDARIGLLYSHYLKIANSNNYKESDLLQLEQEYILALDDFGRNANTITIMQYLGHLQGFYLDKPTEAIAILTEAIEIPNASQINVCACKIELADVLLLSGNVWDAKLYYAQVEKTFKHDPIGFEAKYKNAKLSFYIGEYEWAKAQLDVLKAATSKKIANDALRLSVLIGENIDPDSTTVGLDYYARADLLLFRNQKEEAITTLDSIFEIADYHPIFDEVLLKKAEIRISQGKYVEASELLKKLLADYSWDITADDALFMLAGLYENHLDNQEEARTLYQQLLNDYPSSLYTVEARKKFRLLRGDFEKETLTDEEKFLFNLDPN
ncbi:MAG: tetratricopeptide repeat protein [Bacteroidales bacterium]|nr:tetratricopeptide repeat protein [Bacteroidales bacterium]